MGLMTREAEGLAAGPGLNGLRIAAMTMLAFVCCSCATRPMQGVLVPSAESAEGASRIPILAATTRQRAVADAGEMFSREAGSELSYARMAISIPPDGARTIGEIQWPATTAGDPRRDFVTVSADYLDQAGFNAAIASIARTTRRKKAFVFVHGFNNRFDDATYRLAQIVQDSKIPVIPVLFSWPSRGVIGLRAYRADRDSALQSRDQLNQLLDTVTRNPAVQEVTILCHSMGCLLTLDALRARAGAAGQLGAKITNVLLVAPDVDVEVFREQMSQMGRNRTRFALFLSQDDGALKLSRSLLGGAARLGDIDVEAEPYKTEFRQNRILVFDLSRLKGDAHSRAFEDVTSVMGMIERRLAQGQQLAQDSSRAVNDSE
jgi:esterase/lipase superfamily enzyme